MVYKLKKVKDKKKLPPSVEIKILSEDKKKLKKEMTDLAKTELNKNGGEEWDKNI